MPQRDFKMTISLFLMDSLLLTPISFLVFTLSIRALVGEKIVDVCHVFTPVQ